MIIIACKCSVVTSHLSLFRNLCVSAYHRADRDLQPADEVRRSIRAAKMPGRRKEKEIRF
jgi:hypothetical protein